jgi:hypothetical protein
MAGYKDARDVPDRAAPLSRLRPAFTPQFDRAIAACARAQVLLSASAEAAGRSRDVRASAQRIRRLTIETREAWRGAARINAVMQRQITTVATAMRNAGICQDEATTVVRAHIRFVLYDNGLREVDAEPVVDRATAWVEETYRAA